MENKFGKFLENAGNAAKGAFDKAKEITIQVVDQNDDGKFDMNDVTSVVNVVGDTMKKGADAVMESAEESRKRLDMKALQPIFVDTLDQTEFLMSKLIHVTERDKKHAESDVCQGSIGYMSDKGGLHVVNIFRDSIDTFGLSFYPDADCEFYYVNPTDRDNYISLDSYFSYMKMVRINELQRVAQELGAKHFKVTYKEEQTSFSDTKAGAHLKLGKNQGAGASHETAEKKYSVVDVAAELNMTGHAPRKPELKYLAKDDSVQNLVYLRMNGGEDFHSHRISIKMSNSSGIRESDAAKIDTVLKGMKVAGNATVFNEAKNESRRYLEYEIEF